MLDKDNLQLEFTSNAGLLVEGIFGQFACMYSFPSA